MKKILLCIALFTLPCLGETQVEKGLDMFQSFQTWSESSQEIHNLVIGNNPIVPIQIGEETLHFRMRPNDLKAPGYRAESTGEDGIRRLVPSGPVETFIGQNLENPSVFGRFSIAPNHFDGVIFTPGDWTFIEPLRNYVSEGTKDSFLVYRLSDIKEGEEWRCGMVSRLQQGKTQIETRIASSNPTPLYKVQIATEADPSIARPVNQPKLTPSKVNLEILQILNYVEGVYERELNLTFEVVYQHYWKNLSNSPYSRLSTAAEFLRVFAQHWNTNFRNSVKYDLAHIWYGSFSDGVSGHAYLNTVCSNPDRSYGATNWLANENLYEAAFTTAHEIGHNFSADHPNEQNPPIALCPKTLMDKSQYPQIFTFCQYSRDQIQNHVAAHNSCLEILNAMETQRLKAPYNLTSKALGPNRVFLKWSDNNGQKIDGFILERHDIYDGWEFLSKLNLTQKEFIDGSAQAKKSYVYKVFSYNDEVRSDPSNETQILMPEDVQGIPFISTHWVIPTTVHSGGRYGGTFKTQVRLAARENGVTIKARLYDSEGFQQERNIRLSPHTYWTLDDFFLQVFKKKGGGAVELIAPKPFHLVAVDVYMDTSNGRNITPVINNPNPLIPYQGWAYSYGVTVNDSTRVNLGVFNSSDSDQTVQVQVRSGTRGEAPLKTIEFSLPAKSWEQKSLSAKMNNGYLIWEIPEEAYLYLVSVDNESNDGNLVYPVRVE